MSYFKKIFFCNFIIPLLIGIIISVLICLFVLLNISLIDSQNKMFLSINNKNYEKSLIVLQNAIGIIVNKIQYDINSAKLLKKLKRKLLKRMRFI